jgi:hypothetical protein
LQICDDKPVFNTTRLRKHYKKYSLPQVRVNHTGVRHSALDDLQGLGDGDVHDILHASCLLIAELIFMQISVLSLAPAYGAMQRGT